jgi:nitroimidazol reductase NimA-like FMN-containing flavoprotein (pyridoxamine 5'-phosphate oxidase superfamily)
MTAATFNRHHPAHTVATEMLELSRAECLRLLAVTAVGRLAISVTGWDQPMLRPVNYVFDESTQSVVIRSGAGSKLYALLSSSRAVFEIDGTDPAEHVGWSVIILGVAEEITNPAELRRLETLGLDPWAPGHQDRWFRIRASTVSGRRIAAISPTGRDEEDRASPTSNRRGA